MRGLVLIILVSLIGNTVNSQVHKRYLRKGNDAYSDSNYMAALHYYNSSFDTVSTYDKAQFNLGNAQYKNMDFQGAMNSFAMQAEKSTDKMEKAHAFHNLGNSYLAQYYLASQMAKKASPDTAQMLAQAGFKFLNESVEAYKNSLRNNSTDDETRHNYALAKKLKDQMQSENESGGNDQNQDQEKDQEQDKQDQEKGENQDKNDQEQQEKKEEQDQGDKEENEDQDQQRNEEKEEKEGAKNDPDPKKLSKEDAEKILEALKNKEEKVHQKILKKKKPSKVIKIEKDW